MCGFAGELSFDGRADFYEHYEIAQGVGAVLATPEQLIQAGKELRVRDRSGRERRVHVVYRRTNQDRLRDPGGEATRVGELLLEPVDERRDRAGQRVRKRHRRRRADPRIRG